MKRQIEHRDLALTYQHVMNLSIRVDVYDKDMVYIDSMDCALISGSFNMDSNSDIRRTTSLVISPNVRSRISLLIEEDSLIWINRNVVLSVGIQDHITWEYTYYKLGTFVIMSYSSTYDPVTNQLTINCSDYMAKLDGSKNGELSALVTSFPAYKEFLSTEKTGGTDCYYFTRDKVTYSQNIYAINSEPHTQYTSGDYVVFQIPATNFAGAQFRWNNLATIPIYDIETGRPIEAGRLIPGNNYPFRFGNGALTLTIRKTQPPLETETRDGEAVIKDGSPLAYYKIRDAMVTAVSRLGGITDFNIDEIGEYQAMQQYNPDWRNYRAKNGLWDNIPYDLEFNVGDSVLSIITALRDLYPNYETYFDEDGVFCCSMVPSEYDDEIYIYDSYLQEILISENYDIDTTTVRNVCEVWGASLEVDFTAESCVLKDTCYTIDIPEYGPVMYNGDRIAIVVENSNPANVTLKIHSVYTEETSEPRQEYLDLLNMCDKIRNNPKATPNQIKKLKKKSIAAGITDTKILDDVLTKLSSVIKAAMVNPDGSLLNSNGTVGKSRGGRKYVTFATSATEDLKDFAAVIYDKIASEPTHTEERDETLEAIPIYDEMTDLPLVEGYLSPGTMYVFKIKTRVNADGTASKILYYQSEFQPQAIDVLTDGSVSNEEWSCADGTTTKVWSKKYFADKYGCRIDNINFTVDVFSPLTIQKIGETLSVKQGGEFENITSDQRALARAIYENWKMSRIVDTVVLTTKLCLFLDVNKLVEYRRHDEGVIGHFVITAVSHDFTAGTSSITMTRFRPLYMNE